MNNKALALILLFAAAAAASSAAEPKKRMKTRPMTVTRHYPGRAAAAAVPAASVIPADAGIKPDSRFRGNDTTSASGRPAPARIVLDPVTGEPAPAAAGPALSGTAPQAEPAPAPEPAVSIVVNPVSGETRSR